MLKGGYLLGKRKTKVIYSPWNTDLCEVYSTVLGCLKCHVFSRAREKAPQCVSAELHSHHAQMKKGRKSKCTFFPGVPTQIFHSVKLTPSLSKFSIQNEEFSKTSPTAP